MSQHTHPRKPARRVQVAEDLNASPPTEDRVRKLLRRSHKDARKRSENLRSVVVPAIGAASGYLTNSMPYYSTFPVINPSMYPPYNPPGIPSYNPPGVPPPYIPFAFQYPVLPPILPSTVYDGEVHESSSEADEDSPPPPPPPPLYTLEEFNAATEDVCCKFIDAVISTLVLDVVCGCIEEIVKSYLRQSKLLIEPPVERVNMGSDAIPTQIRRHSIPMRPSRAPPLNAGRGPLLHPAKLAALPRPLFDPAAARDVAVHQPASYATRFDLECVDVLQFGTEAELCHNVIAQMVDQLVFVHLMDMAMDDGAGALVRVACRSLLYDMIMAELLNRLV